MRVSCEVRAQSSEQHVTAFPGRRPKLEGGSNGVFYAALCPVMVPVLRALGSGLKTRTGARNGGKGLTRARARRRRRRLRRGGRSPRSPAREGTNDGDMKGCFRSYSLIKTLGQRTC